MKSAAPLLLTTFFWLEAPIPSPQHLANTNITWQIPYCEDKKASAKKACRVIGRTERFSKSSISIPIWQI
jgi:hypothetical protein